MTVYQMTPKDGLYYEYDPPKGKGGKPTVVFVNALTGSTDAWQAAVGPAVRDAGLGTLCYNFRGQADSPYDSGLTFDDKLIAGDLVTLLDHVKPPRPILCGLSIGGLFAARAVLAGAEAEGLILLNTLRKPGLRLDWLNEAMLRVVKLGGTRMVADMYFPLLTNPQFQEDNRSGFLLEDPYEAPPAGHAHVKLMAAGGLSDWDVPYEDLKLPTLVVSGLKDGVFFVAEDVDELYARLPDARRFDWPDAGHLLPAERPERLAETIIDFAKSLGS
jgi:pimeloyl-ACP methyl ester carboxylesterase